MATAQNDGERELNPSQYLANMSDAWTYAIRSTLGEFIQSEADADADLYDRMMRDGEVDSAISTRIDAVLAEGYTVVPAVAMPRNLRGVDPAQLAKAKRAQEIADFVKEAVGPNLIESMGQSLEALKYGNAAHEIVLKPKDGKLVLGELVDLERRHRYEFEGNNLLGVKLDGGSAITGTMPGVFIPKGKLLIHSHRPRGRDPRGRPLLWAAYTAWYAKNSVFPEFLRHLKQFASPSFLGETRNKEENTSGMVEVIDENGQIKKNELGENVLVTEGYQLFNALRKFRNGSVIVVPGGSKVTPLWPQGDGTAFPEGLAYFDRSIHRSINGTARVSYEAEHSSGADSKEAIDVFKVRVGRNQEDIGRTYSRLFKLIVVLNFPPEDHELAPTCHVGGSSQATWEERADGVAKLSSSGYLDESQYPEMDAELGLPVRDAEAIAKRDQEKEFQKSVEDDEKDKVMKP